MTTTSSRIIDAVPAIPRPPVMVEAEALPVLNALPAPWVIECSACGGSGKTTIPNPFALPKALMDCPKCEGYGGRCRACRNIGRRGFDVPVGHPLFGKLVPCDKCGVYQHQLAHRMQHYNRVPLHLAALPASFDTFPPEMDKKAIATMRDYVAHLVARDTKGKMGVIVRGPNQIGKTGLAYCVHAALLAQNVASLFLPAIHLFQMLQEALMNDEDKTALPVLMGKLASITHLVIDDLGSEKPTEKRLEFLYELLDARVHTPGCSTLITTNLEIRHITAAQEAAGEKCQMEEVLGTKVFARIYGRHFGDVKVGGRKRAITRSKAEHLAEQEEGK